MPQTSPQLQLKGESAKDDDDQESGQFLLSEEGGWTPVHPRRRARSHHQDLKITKGAERRINFGHQAATQGGQRPSAVSEGRRTANFGRSKTIRQVEAQ